ncbi:alpha-actinin [Savitreella phatthalungensis]
MVAVNLDEASWVETQHRTFTTWLNTQLAQRPDITPADDIVTGLSDGTRLIQLLEIISDESLGRYNRTPRLRVQKAENVNKALEFVRSRGIPLTNIGAEDFIDGNLKIMCGLLWTLILRFTIADIQVDGLSAKEGLLLWCQRKTQGYTGVDVTNFSTSWSDGLAFCALLHKYRPDLIQFDRLDVHDARSNTAKAFSIAAECVDIPPLLSVQDVCDVSRPDERSVMTYIAQYFHAFSHLDKVETAGRRLDKFVDTVHSAWVMQVEYERRMAHLYSSIEKIKQEWAAMLLPDRYDDAKALSIRFSSFKKVDKRAWVREKSSLESLFGNIQTKLQTYQLRPWQPRDGMCLGDLETCWRALLEAEAKAATKINHRIYTIKENLRISFAAKTNDFAHMLSVLSNHLSNLDGELEEQQAAVQNLAEHLEPLHIVLEEISAVSKECERANVEEENDHTIYSYDDVAFQYKLARESILKRLHFIDTQLIARSKSNVTPGQLEEIDSVFRHFDRDSDDLLVGEDFVAALASLGLTYDDNETQLIWERVGTSMRLRQAQNSLSAFATKDRQGGHGHRRAQSVASARTRSTSPRKHSQQPEAHPSVDYEAFLDLILDELEDQDSPEQVLAAFKEVADGRNFVTERDLQHAQISQTAISYLREAMPVVQTSDRDLDDDELPSDLQNDRRRSHETSTALDYVAFMSELVFDDKPVAPSQDSGTGSTK